MKHDALEKAEESNRELLEHIESLQKIAYEQPVIIPVETAYTDNVVSKRHNRGVAFKADDYKVISAAYANGTRYSADTFLAEENGAEIVTNAHGYQVYTAEETKDIFDTYTRIVSFLPMLQRVNTAASVKAPELSAGNESAAPVSVTITIEQNINGGDPEGLRESNEELIHRIREVMEEICRDGRRRAFN